MKKLKGIGKKLLITYLIIYITISSMSSCFARMYDAECGEYVSQYARDFIEKYCTPMSRTHYYTGELKWGGGKEFSGDFYACCTTGVHYMYKNALGVDITKFGYSMGCPETKNQMLASDNWIKVPLNELEPGDIVANDSHVELYIGDGQDANFGNEPNSGKITTFARKKGPFTHAFRPNFDVNPAGTIPVGDIEEEDLSIYDENGFIYSGVAKIEGYKSSMPFGKWIVKCLLEILDYLVGIMTMGFRIVVVGWTAIIERNVMDGIVNSVTGVTNERVDDWQKDPNEVDEIDEEAEAEKSIKEPSQATGTEGDPEYISSGVQGIADSGGKVQLKTTSEANVTIENIVYNKIPILDINFFNFESAGGAVVDPDGVIYIIKTNISMWYYIFRILAIVIMLLVLIYLGIKIAITSATDKKAVYKQMLVDWLVGFLLVFAISYIMYGIIWANEAFIEWVTPQYESGKEISLYESVRSKAYELKATTGFAGMAMYVMMVYYAIRFLIVYFKRFLTVTILAVMAPFVAVSYALEKINKKGNGKRRNIRKLVKRLYIYSYFTINACSNIYNIYTNCIRFNESFSSRYSSSIHVLKLYGKS